MLRKSNVSMGRFLRHIYEAYRSCLYVQPRTQPKGLGQDIQRDQSQAVHVGFGHALDLV